MCGRSPLGLPLDTGPFAGVPYRLSCCLMHILPQLKFELLKQLLSSFSSFLRIRLHSLVQQHVQLLLHCLRLPCRVKQLQSFLFAYDAASFRIHVFPQRTLEFLQRAVILQEPLSLCCDCRLFRLQRLIRAQCIFVQLLLWR